MNKIVAITGHTSGIGKGIYERLKYDGWEVLGFSRSNNYDITDSAASERIIQESTTADIFINNAEYKISQTDLLYGLFKFWRYEEEKIILNIGSVSGIEVKNFVHPYSAHKATLEAACKQLQNTEHKCRIINLRPGWVDTPKVAHLDAAQKENKLSVNDITNTILWIINQPKHVYINDLTIQPRTFVK